MSYLMLINCVAVSSITDFFVSTLSLYFFFFFFFVQICNVHAFCSLNPAKKKQKTKKLGIFKAISIECPHRCPPRYNWSLRLSGRGCLMFSPNPIVDAVLCCCVFGFSFFLFFFFLLRDYCEYITISLG
jgi:hypothetical protein